MHVRGPSNINQLASLFAPLMFAGIDNYVHDILIPRGCASFGQHQESQPLDRSGEILVLTGFANTIEWDQNQSDLSDLALSMRRVTGSP